MFSTDQSQILVTPILVGTNALCRSGSPNCYREFMDTQSNLAEEAIELMARLLLEEADEMLRQSTRK